ncbi:MAG: hypothetical protein U0325_36955, partial [Polyangiales bacterium]
MRPSRALLVVAMVLWATAAHAITDFLSPFSRAGEVEFATTPGATLQATLDARGWLSWRSYEYASGRPANFTAWARRQAPPGSPAQRFFLTTGVVGVQAPSTWSGPRMYVMSAPESPPLPGFSSQLWELAWPAGPAGPATWRNVTGAGGPALGSAPQIAAATHLGRVYVGLRASNGALWTCRLDAPNVACAWEEETCRGAGGCHAASPDSPLGMMVGAGGDLELFSLSGAASPQVQRYRWSADTWDALPSVPGRFVDASALPCDAQNGESRVYATLWDGASAGDELWVARNNGGGWSWSRLLLPEGDPASGYAYQTHALAVQRGRHDVLAVTRDGTALARCRVPASIPSGATAFCEDLPGPGGLLGSNVFRMPEELLAGRDTLGMAVFAGNHYALIPASLGNATYQYGVAFAPSPTAWANFLAARDPTQQFAVDDSEFEADNFFGRVAVASRSRVWLSHDDGNTWGPMMTPVPDGSWNTLSFANDGSLYVAANMYASSNRGIRIARWTASGGWGTAVDVPPSIFPINNDGVYERPWLRMDRARSHFGFLTFRRFFAGAIAYCNGASTCDGGPSAWCGPWELPRLSPTMIGGGYDVAFAGPPSNRKA